MPTDTLTMTSRLLGSIALVACTAAAEPPYRFGPIDAYLQQFGMDKLKKLDMRFGDLVLDGDSRIYVQGEAGSDAWKRPPGGSGPTITWSLPAGTSAMVAFLDLDAGGRPASDTDAGRLGPFVHSLWADCDGNSLTSCKKVVRPYRAPGNNAVAPNRYTYLLLRQDGPARIDEKAAGFRFGTRFSLARLKKDNPGLTPEAYNFMLVRGDQVKKAKKGLRRGRRTAR